MSTRARLLVTSLAVWSLFVWINRITNAWTGDEGLISKLISTVIAAGLLALSIAAVSEVWRRGSERAVPLAKALAGATVVVWLVRLPLILLGGWDLGFLAVHTVLALASMALAVVVWRAVGREPAALEGPSRPTLLSGP